MKCSIYAAFHLGPYYLQKYLFRSFLYAKGFVSVLQSKAFQYYGWGSEDNVFIQGWHRLKKYLNIQDCLGKSLKIKFALKST